MRQTSSFHSVQTATGIAILAMPVPAQLPDAAIGDDTGLIAVMSSAATLNLTGNALGTGGVSTISLGAGKQLGWFAAG